MKNIKQIGSLIAYLARTTWGLVRSRNTWIAVAFIVWTYLIAWVNSNYYFQSPIKSWQCMACKRGQAVKVVTHSAVIVKPTIVASKPIEPKIDEKEIVTSQKNGAILWKIYMLESTRGKNDGCRKSGKFGGFGVMDNNHKVVCYDSFEQAASRAAYWFDLLHPEKNLASAICQWNLGLPNQVTCDYYESYLNL